MAKLLDAKTATGAGTPWAPGPVAGPFAFQGQGSTSSGSGAAVFRLQGSNSDEPATDGEWTTLATFSLTLGTAITTDAAVVDATYKRYRGYVDSISGTGAAVSLIGNP